MKQNPEHDLWMRLQQHGQLNWSDWWQWNHLYISRIFPPMKPILAAYAHHFDTPTTRQVQAERSFLKLTDEHTFTYGETSWHTWLRILDLFSVQQSDRLLDLGCGNGQLCFLAPLKYGISATGVEKTQTFVKTAQVIANDLEISNVQFISQDFMRLNWSVYTLFYITCTCFSEDYMQQILEKFQAEAPPGARIATITNPLNAPTLKLLCTFKGWFNWGEDVVWVYRVTPTKII